MNRRILLALMPLALLLASPSAAFALNINEDYKPQNEFKLDPWINLPGPFDINKAVFYVLMATALMTFTITYVAKRMQERPNRVQTAVEAAFTLMRDTITRTNMDDTMAAKW